MHAAARKWIFHLVSLGLAALLFWLLFRGRDWSALGRTPPKELAWLGAAAGLAVVYWGVRILRWRWIAGLEGQTISLGLATRSMLAGLAVGLLTPMRGGEVVRPLFLPPGCRVKLAGWVVIERVFDLSAVLIFCLLGLPYLWRHGVLQRLGLPWEVLLAGAGILLCLALLGPALVMLRPRRLWRVLERLLPAKAAQLAQIVITGRQLCVFLASSLLAELLSIVAVYFCLSSFGAISLPLVLALTPVVMLNNLLPITPGGLGVREGLAVLMFAQVWQVADPRERVLAAYLANTALVLLAPAAVGAVMAWLSGFRLRGRTASATAPAAEAVDNK
jgi:hypothetical protein